MYIYWRNYFWVKKETGNHIAVWKYSTVNAGSGGRGTETRTSAVEHEFLMAPTAKSLT
jgi:hypothetical protein